MDRAIELVAPHCDIVERLAVVPPSARVRGLYLKSLETLLQPSGNVALYRRYFAGERWSALRMYPLRDYMIRLAVAGAALRSPEHVHEGMHDVWRTNATTFANSLLGRTMLRLLSHDPVRLTEQGLAARRQTYQYGHWSIVRHGPRSIEMVYREEYIWIESAIAGGAVGAFEACGIEVNLQTKLLNRFDGSTVISW
ncbi:MAG TPA: TIGR02265 family protein [Polyangiaceae bacterium]|nr:TIGR02265 family protein [Polyangiaceae bacterium]